MPSIGALLISIQAKTDELERGMATVRKELATTRSSIKETGNDLRSFGDQLAGLGRAGLAAAGITLSLQGIKRGLEDIVKTGIQLRGLQTTFSQLAGSAEAGRKEFAFVTETANRLGVDLQTLAGSYRGLTAATRGTGLEGAATRELFTALTQATQAFGLSSEQAGRALLAFQQIISKGKVSQEELRQQLGEAIPGANQIAARAFGVTTQELEKLVEKGVDGIDFAKKFTAQLQREIPAATQIAGKGFVELRNELELFKGRIESSGVGAFFERAAEFGTRILRRGREEAEQAGNTQRADFQRQGVNPSVARQEQIAALARINAEIKATEALLQTPLTARKEDDGRRALAEMRRQQQDLISGIQQEGLERQRTGTVAAQENARITEELRKETAAKETAAQFDEFLFETEKKRKQEEDKAIEELAEAEKREAETAVDGLKKKQTALEQFIATQKLELEQLTLSPQDLRNKLVERVTAEFGEGPGREAGRIEDIKATQQAIREVEDILDGLADKDEKLTQKLLADRELLSRERVKIDRRDFRELEQITDSYASFFTNSLLSATDIARSGFKDFVDSAIRDLIRLNAQTYLTPFLSRLLQTGVKTAVSLLGSFGGTGGAPASLDAGSVAGGLGAIPGLAEGGPFLPNRFYTVGEEGPEVLYSGNSSGRVYPNGGAPSGLVVNGPLMAVYANDAGSFRRSSGEIENRLLATVSRAQRNA